MKLSVVCSLFLASSYFASAQTAATLASAGYASLPPIPVAPGQVVTLFFRDVGPLPGGSLRVDEAKTVPLPTVLAGLSVFIKQPSVRFPIFAVRQENDCFDGQSNPACLLTSLRVQLPFDLKPVKELVLEVDGESSRSFLLTEVSDNAHVLTSCDLTWNTNWASTCSRLAFHTDGSAVTEKSPARPGETIVVYLWGMGATTPSVPIGTPAPPGVVVKQVPGITAVRARFLDGPRVNINALPAFYSPEDASEPGVPIEFLGLTPGQIGLYQLNVAIPNSFTPSTFCGDPIAGQSDTIPANAVLHITTLYAGTQELDFCLRR